MSDTMPGARSVCCASSNRRWMFSLNAGRLSAKLDHLLRQVAERARRRRAGRVLGDGLAGERCLAELHGLLDHGGKDAVVAEPAQVRKHLPGEDRAPIKE